MGECFICRWGRAASGQSAPHYRGVSGHPLCVGESCKWAKPDICPYRLLGIPKGGTLWLPFFIEYFFGSQRNICRRRQCRMKKRRILRYLEIYIYPDSRISILNSLFSFGDQFFFASPKKNWTKKGEQGRGLTLHPPSHFTCMAALR